MKLARAVRWLVLVLVCFGVLSAGGAVGAMQELCGPFTDVSPLFCPYILEAYYTGITAGTSATTFSPDAPITRGQAAVFVTKGLDQALGRGSRRAALGQWWTTTPHYDFGLGLTPVGSDPEWVTADGTDLWVANRGDGTVSRVRASDGKLLGNWSGAGQPQQIIVALGRVLVLSRNGGLYLIDPSQPEGSAQLAAATGPLSFSMTFDGDRFWVSSDDGSAGSMGVLQIVTPTAALPWTITSVTNDQYPLAGTMGYDGANVWLFDLNGYMLRLDDAGSVINVVQGPYALGYPTFDGKNFWVPSGSGLSVVNAETGSIVTLTGNGMVAPSVAAFDGQRVLVTSGSAAVNRVSLWKAADLTPLGYAFTGNSTQPVGVCSDGINFWITLSGSGQLARF